MKRMISVLLCCTLLLTACAAPEESSLPSSDEAAAASTTSSATTDVTSTAETSAATSTTATTTAPPVESESADSSDTEFTAEAETAPDTEEISAESTSDTPVATEAVTSTATSATIATSAATSATTVTASTSATTTTAATSATATIGTTTTVTEQPEEEPDFPEFRYDDSSTLRMTAYGIDTEQREKLYTELAAETKLPVIHVSTENGDPIMSREDYNNCLVDMFNCDEEYILRAQSGGIRIRGNSTAYYGDPSQVLRNQVPYRIKFDEKTSMLGLNGGAECKSWVLLKATWNILPDYIAFQLAETLMKDDYYSSDCEFAYVYVNEEFKGLYLLCEQNQINKHRVDLPEVEKGYKGTDIGYFLEIDNYAYENPYWFTVDYCGETLTDLEGTERELVPADYTIKNDVYSDEQVQFISQYINDVYRLMVQAIKYGKYYEFDESNTLVPAQDKYDSAYECVNAEVDLDSVVNMYILYEIAHDYDCGEGSFYMAVDFSGESSFDKLTFTAPWDFNWAYSDSAVRKYYAGAFNSMSFVNQYGDRTNPWFVLLMGTDWFREMVEARWQELYDAGEITGTLDDIADYLAYYYDDFTVEPLYWASNAEELLKWVRYRVKWLNMEWGSES